MVSFEALSSSPERRDGVGGTSDSGSERLHLAGEAWIIEIPASFSCGVSQEVDSDGVPKDERTDDGGDRVSWLSTSNPVGGDLMKLAG